MRVMIEKLQCRASIGPFDLQHNLQLCAMDMICGNSVVFFFKYFEIIFSFRSVQRPHLV